VLIDRSLVLGTVDRPQLHDVMLEFVKKELAGEQYKRAQRRLVDSFRKSNRSPSSATGKYMQLYIKHHITESYDEVWGKSLQAMSWLEDHVNGIQDAIAISTASILPDVQALAMEAEDAKRWWPAALRWIAFALHRCTEMGTNGAGFEFYKRAVGASANITIQNNSSTSNDERCTQFELDSLNLNAVSKIVLSWDPAALAEYGERVLKLAATEAGKSRPVLLVRIALATEWFPGILTGNADKFAAVNWMMTKMLMDLNDESSDAYARLTDDERYLIKPCALTYIVVGGEAMMHVPGFDIDVYGPNGDKLLELSNAYTYDDHHAFYADLCTLDTWMTHNSADWILTLQYGRVSDALPILNQRLSVLEKVVADTTGSSRILDVACGMQTLLVCCHLLGQAQEQTQKMIQMIGFTFDTVDEYLIQLTKSNPLFTKMEQREPGGGVFPIKRLLWQMKSFLVMHTNVPAVEAIAWLESLPDDEAFYQYSMTMPTFDYGGFWGGLHHTCWVALAHEKVGLYDGALRFCRLALEPDPMKAGVPSIKWALTVALACKGRVLTKLNRHSEALVAFQAAVATGKESYPMIEALAYRELANCKMVADAPTLTVAAAAQAGRDLDEKLKEFDGRLTLAEFDMLSIAPPLAPATGSPSSPLFSGVPTTPSLLPDGKHVFLSYQWDVQAQVVQIKALLNERNVKCWMDIDGGMKSNIYDSVSILHVGGLQTDSKPSCLPACLPASLSACLSLFYANVRLHPDDRILTTMFRWPRECRVRRVLFVS
jgi:hypothetical protein